MVESAPFHTAGQAVGGNLKKVGRAAGTREQFVQLFSDCGWQEYNLWAEHIE